MINDKKIPKIGSRAKVMHGSALQTAGGLSKQDLKYNYVGKIVSKKQSSLKEKKNKKTSKKQKAGASDWISTTYSAGPVNGPTINENQFRAFTKNAPYVPNESLSGLKYAPVVQTSNSLFVPYKQPNSAF